MRKDNNFLKLNWLGLAAALVSLHFGLGFLLGSGEAIYIVGPKGILYAISTAIGLFALSFIAGYYWRVKSPIWDLLGSEYGKSVRKIVAFLSGAWMFGVLASQILGGAAVLTIFRFNKYLSMSIITVLILMFSLTDIKKVSKILLVTILVTGAILIYLQFVLGWSWAKTSLNSFVLAVPTIDLSDLVNILIPTVLVTFIGMDFHQFIVRAKSSSDAIWGNIVGGLILLVISFFTLNIVFSSISSNFIQNISDPAQVVPAILLNFGHSINPVLGELLPIMIIFVATGSGSGIQRIILNTLKSFKLNGKIYQDKTYAVGVSVLCFFLALTGKSIIGLIVNFYAIYIGSVFPLFVYLLLQTKFPNFRIGPKYVRLSLYLSFSSALIFFFAQFFPLPFLKSNASALIIASGFLMFTVTVIYTYLVKIRFFKGFTL